MVKIVKTYSKIKAAGKGEKSINEVFGRINTQNENISIALMESPKGWEEPGQTPDFDEYTVVFEGQLHVETKTGSYVVHEGQAIEIKAGEWVKYSTPDSNVRYIAICTPAFSPETVHRDD